jgi:Protein of unknown function (DUF3455)
MRNLIRAIGMFAVVICALAFGQERPVVPENLQAPAGEKVILHAHATGVQIYVCQAEAGQDAAWVLKAPEAELTDAIGKKIAHHSVGPSWTHSDGSVVIGKVVAKQDAPKPGAIPWLLLTAASHKGDGFMARVTTIQRIYTDGGLPPKASDCDVAANAKESRSAYSADYYFYAPAQK